LRYTGLRVQQAGGVVWTDVHLDDVHVRRHGGPVLWVGHGKTKAEHFGRFLPLHPALVAWLRDRSDGPGTVQDLGRDLRRTESKAYNARTKGLADRRVAWEVGDQNVSLQLSKAWEKAGVAPAAWRGRTAHAFRKAVRTNIMENAEPGARTWPAAETLLGHDLPGQVDVYQAERALMPTMRQLIERIPAWEEAARSRQGKVVQMSPRSTYREDLEALG
jgi:integrase